MLQQYSTKAQELSVTVPVLIDQIRAYAMAEHVSPSVIKVCHAHGLYVPKIRDEYQTHEAYFRSEARGWWNDYAYHLSHRLEGDKDFEIFLKLFPEYTGQEGLKKYLKDAYDLSILPLNLSCGMENAVKNHLPEPEYQSKIDPYAIKHKNVAIVEQKGDGNFYVATRKKKYATYLLTLTVPWSLDPTKGTFLCPIGCTHCYRGNETRNRKNIKITETNEELLSSRIQDQTTALVKRWDPDVYDVLVSGGEPLLFHNGILKRDVIDVLKKCPHLKSFRICTGALALGLFSRFNDEFIKMLVDLREEKHIQVGINAHVVHPENFTPEMIEKSLLLKKNNIRIMPQVPLVEGVNFWNHDLSKTLQTLRRLSRLSVFILNDPVYKYIVDMQCSVSLLQAIRVYRSLFDRHQGESNIVKPTAFELFVEGSAGNVNLSYHTLFAIKMEIDETRKFVTYTIPHPSGETVYWSESLLEGINDHMSQLTRAISEPPIEE